MKYKQESENSPQKSLFEGMVEEIKSVKQLSKFSGNIVSFNSIEDFGSCFSIEGKLFAYVGEQYKYYSYSGGQSGYDFLILFQNNKTRKPTYSMTTAYLEKLSLNISLATEEEINAIKEAIQNDEAGFPHYKENQLVEKLRVDTNSCRV